MTSSKRKEIREVMMTNGTRRSCCEETEVKSRRIRRSEQITCLR